MNKYKGKINVMGYDIPITIPKSYLDYYTTGQDNLDGIRMTMGYLKSSGVGSIMRQVLNYLKKKGDIQFDKLWVRTETYSGGDSIRVYTLGTDDKSFQIMKDISSLFQSGTFNGMEDIYEYDNYRLQASIDVGIQFQSDSGLLDVECTTKYNFVYMDIPWDVKDKMREVV